MALKGTSETTYITNMCMYSAGMSVGIRFKKHEMIKCDVISDFNTNITQAVKFD